MKDRIDKVQEAMEEYFGPDIRRIDHALRVTGFARRILKHEPGDEELVLCTAILHDIGIREAERKYSSSAGHLQEIEGPPIAREILERLGYLEPFIEEACRIIASHHSPGEVDTDDFKVIWDADWLVNMGDEMDLKDREKVERVIRKVFLTATGKKLAGEIYLAQPK